MMKYLLTITCLTFFFNVTAQTSDELTAIFAEIDSINDRYGSRWGDQGHPETYPFETVEDEINKAEEYKTKIQQLQALQLEARQDQISRDVMIYRLENHLSYVKFKVYLMPFNAEGGFYSQPVFFMRYLPFEDEDDYMAYLKWVPSFAEFLEYQQSLLQQGIDENVMRPKVIVRNNIKLMETFTEQDFEKHPFAQPFLEFPQSMTEEQKMEFLALGKEVVMGIILPAYQNLYAFMTETYLPASPEGEGISGISNGKAYYEDRVRHFTTLEISPDSVFNLGMSEVGRINKAMNEIIKELEFEGDFAQFLQYLRTDPQFYAKTPQELLNRAAWLSKKAEGQLPKLFSELYDLPFTVEPVPDAIAPAYTGGRYVRGNREQDRAGIYWVNTYDLPSRTLYTLPALTVHEAVPGHHLDAMMTEILEGVPDFRKNYYISAYGEGWGLYSEYLGEEMGMYSTPYEWFGRYTYEMWRACRLVVDVGIHYKGWSRQQAVDFLASNSALSIHEVNTEIDRYIGWPGQALSYKIGELTIKKLREEATEALGDDFDIQKFHAAILANGSVPLPILRNEVETYIASDHK